MTDEDKISMSGWVFGDKEEDTLGLPPSFRMRKYVDCSR